MTESSTGTDSPSPGPTSRSAVPLPEVVRRRCRRSLCTDVDIVSISVWVPLLPWDHALGSRIRFVYRVLVLENFGRDLQRPPIALLRTLPPLSSNLTSPLPVLHSIHPDRSTFLVLTSAGGPADDAPLPVALEKNIKWDLFGRSAIRSLRSSPMVPLDLVVVKVLLPLILGTYILTSALPLARWETLRTAFGACFAPAMTIVRFRREKSPWALLNADSFAVLQSVPILNIVFLWLYRMTRVFTVTTEMIKVVSEIYRVV